MKTVERPQIKLEETASTNSWLKELNRRQRVEEGTIVRAISQTAGRGQAGNSWESESGRNLTFSILLRPQAFPVRQQFLLSEMVALAVQELLSEELPDITIKWPNDIYHADRKICGILIENEIEGDLIVSSVAGIGLNVNQTEFRSAAPNPVSMKQITGKEYDLDSLLENLADRLFEQYKLLQSQPGELSARYFSRLYRSNGFFSFWDQNGEFAAKITGVKPEGNLVLTTESGEERSYLFKEVSFFPPQSEAKEPLCEWGQLGAFLKIISNLFG